jgi:carbamoyltransferase
MNGTSSSISNHSATAPRRIEGANGRNDSRRLQTGHRAANPLYYRLIEAFRDPTGVPMVLNTSFNENEPIVCTPAQALDCFLRTRMDLLVLGDVLIRRQG